MQKHYCDSGVYRVSARAYSRMGARTALSGKTVRNLRTTVSVLKAASPALKAVLDAAHASLKNVEH